MLEAQLDKGAFATAYESIIVAYRKHLPVGSRLNPAPSLHPEDFAACWAAECHRQFWKPERVRLTLIAESHVYTDSDDLKAQIRPDLLPPEAAAASTQYERLIYCLAYGDSSILTRVPQQSNEHTKFWNLFAECAGVGLGTAYSVTGKVQILKKLKKRGIWLADASLHACMNPRFPWNKTQRDRRRNIECFPDLYREVINASWKYVRTTIPDCRKWIVGKCVRDNIDDLSLDRTRWFYQPGAGLGKVQKTIQEAHLRCFRDELAALLAERGAEPERG